MDMSEQGDHQVSSRQSLPVRATFAQQSVPPAHTLLGLQRQCQATNQRASMNEKTIMLFVKKVCV